MAFIRFIGLALLFFFCFAMGQVPSNEANGIAKLGSALFFLVAPALYLLPTYEASLNKQPNLTSIFLVNLLLGWTFLGWVGAMVWAFNKPSTVVVVDAPAPASASVAPVVSAATKICPFCAESIKAEAKVCRYCQRDQPETTVASEAIGPRVV